MQLDAALPRLAEPPQVWVHGGGRGIDEKIESFAAAPLEADELRQVTIDDRALCIYTSGTTGMPKAANVSHARVMQWGQWFAGMMDVQPERPVVQLPAHVSHSVGGVLAPGAMLAAGGSLVVREKFSASQFLGTDIIRWECTAFQYIGELCRYLLHRRLYWQEPETAHRLRIACGNGACGPGVWEAFQQRFSASRKSSSFTRRPREASRCSTPRASPEPLATVPPYLAHRFAPAAGRLRLRQRRACPRRERLLCSLRR